MIVVTGAAGFIGSCLVQKLNLEGYIHDVIVVDDFYKDYKDPNLDNKSIRDWVHRDLFLPWFKKVKRHIDFVFHLGARTDTVEKNKEIFDRLNLNYSKEIWNICTEHSIPLVYASSAATYGLGENGFDDNHKGITKLNPLNEYAKSKHAFDLWALKQKSSPPNWAGLKFFNVYGPNEYFKNRMASVIFHLSNQARTGEGIQLFKSHKKEIKNGYQARDFIYVMDVIDVCTKFLQTSDKYKGIYNVGTGKGRTYLDLAKNLLKSMEAKGKINFIDTPIDIRDSYQYFSEAKMDKLMKQFPDQSFTGLEEGIENYVQKYLLRRINF
jgi:ADP-L-glycero-D-manno-heptose 6-epimerase